MKPTLEPPTKLRAGARQIRKVLVCNRGEIAIRIFRSCTEAGIGTVAIYSHEDRFSLHRYKADEAYQIGKPGAPVQSYLNISEIISIALRCGADAIHPGYGFLSERAALREACERAGLLFVGPSDETLDIAGDKVKTRELAAGLGIPLVPGSGALQSHEEAAAFVKAHGLPIIIKASFGGGGRGMRVVHQLSELRAEFEAARAEAEAVFGRPEVFLEKFIARPKHVEVQLLGDGSGEVIHLLERDCSVQRRYQKIIEVAPAAALSDAVREKLYTYALSLGRRLKLLSAATAEFLVDEDDAPYFIEINPRIQVEHTITEEITGVDLVQSQLMLAQGTTLQELGLRQERIKANGVAIQCRITTEDPGKDFLPDYGKLLAYRTAEGFGIRLDGGSAFTGATITPYYDSLLVKVTARGRDMNEAGRRLHRALSEFRIRGVATNIPFLLNLVAHPVFLSGEARTSFFTDSPEVFVFARRQDRANRLLRFLAETTVGGHESMPKLAKPLRRRTVEIPAPVPEVTLAAGQQSQEAEKAFGELRRPAGWRDVFLQAGKQELLNQILREKKLLITDTTFRDAHQSLLATRVRTFDMLQAANALSYRAAGLFSLEMWGGATFDVALRFLREDPWERLIQLREAIPNILFQMLLRGSNAVGYTRYPDNVIRAFIAESHQAGIDLFRIFDCLNNLDRMRAAIDAVQESGAIAEVCLCFTGDLLGEESKKRGAGASKEAAKFDLGYWCGLARSFVDAGADIIAIKDMAGLLRPYAAELLVKALKQEVGVPIHFHTHDTAGVQSASYIKSAEAGVDIVDCAFAAMSGGTSQPTLEGLVAALEHSERSTGLSLGDLTPFSSYWEAVRSLYEPFESDLRAATAEVYTNEIPGGQYSNFRPQAESLGLGHRWTDLKKAYAEVNTLLGGIVKVTPSSKVVGDFALFMVANDLGPEEVLARAERLDFPASVVSFFKGELGVPFGGFPEALRRAVLRGESGSEPPELPPADLEQARTHASTLLGHEANIRDALSYLLYPKVFEEYAAAKKLMGNLSDLPTSAFFYGLEKGEEIEVDIEPGKRLIIRLIVVSEPNEHGERTVFFELSGQPRAIIVRDKKTVSSAPRAERAEAGNANHVGAPLAGIIASMAVGKGSTVKKDEPLFTIEAMKMQTIVRAAQAGTIKRVARPPGSRIEVGELILELE